MREKSSISDPTDAAGAIMGPACGPRAQTTRVCRCLGDLARSPSEMRRPFAARRAEAVILFVRQGENDFARAGLSVERRASLVVRAATLRDAVASENWDEVRATAREIAMDLGAYISVGRANDDPATPAPPAPRAAGLLRRVCSYFRDSIGAVEPAGEETAETAEDAPTRTASVEGTDVAPD